MTDPRNDAYDKASALASEALATIGAAHANDVAALGETVRHLAAVMDVADRCGWRPTWAQDSAILEEARTFLAALTEEDTPDGSTPQDAPADAARRPAGGPAAP